MLLIAVVLVIVVALPAVTIATIYLVARPDIEIERARKKALVRQEELRTLIVEEQRLAHAIESARKGEG